MEVTLKAEQSQKEAAKKHEEEKKELLRKLSDLVRRESQGDWWPAGAERVAGRTAVAR